MKIAFLVNEFPKISETFILNQITGLLDLGHEVEIFAKENPKEDKIHADVYRYNLFDKLHYFEKIPDNIFIVLIKTVVLLLKNIHNNPIRIIKSLYVFKKKKYGMILGYYYFIFPFSRKNHDVLQCHFGPNGNIGAYLKQSGFRFKVVTMFHGYDIRLGIKKGGEIYSLLFQTCDRILSISEYNRKNIIAFGANEKKIIYHPVGIDVTKYPYKKRGTIFSNGKKTIITTVARLVEEKGLEYGIEAIRNIVRKHPEHTFEYRIVGNGESESYLRELTKEYELDRYVRFLGAMDQEEIIKTLMQSDIFLLPSIEEALPVVLMEAQAMGLPVIATDVGSTSQIVIDGNTGFIVPKKEPAALEDRLLYLMDHPELWDEMGRNGRNVVESRYDINVLNRKLVDIYQEVLSN